MPMARAQGEKRQLIRRLLRLPRWGGYQPVPWSLDAAECLQGVPAGRADKTVGLARGGMELGPLVKRAARAGDLRGCHLGLGRPPNKGSGNDSRPCGLKLSALGGVERAEHPDEEPAPLRRGFCPVAPISPESDRSPAAPRRTPKPNAIQCSNASRVRALPGDPSPLSQAQPARWHMSRMLASDTVR
jgi:hypothetical protein